MNSDVNDITFDDNGVCNYCTEFYARYHSQFDIDDNEKRKELDKLLYKIKRSGKNKKYDCIVGLSGGVDSAWVLVHAVKHGLRPLAVHMDNGWNSELSQNNIENIVKILGVDLYTYVIDWNEYRNMMQSFFDADVIDVELLMDNAMTSINYQQANKYGIKYILAGTNQSTEGMNMPRNWNWFKYDKKNIASIVDQFGGNKFESYPAFGIIDYIWYVSIKKIEWVSYLDFFDYNKNEAIKILEEQFRFKPYPYKHYESIFTRFYQGYLLPTKFNVDKRLLHLSTLIVSGQISRNAALRILETPPYPDNKQLKMDEKYFLKKMEWEPEALEAYLGRPAIAHDKYPSERERWVRLVKFKNAIRNISFIRK